MRGISDHLTHYQQPDSSVDKESACNAGDLSLILGWRRSAGEGIGYSLQYSGLENSMDYIVHGVTKSQTKLSDFHFQHPVETKRSEFKSVERTLRKMT